MPTQAELALSYPLRRCPFCGRSRIAVLAFNPSAARYDRGWFVAHGGKGCVLSGIQSRGYKTPDLAAAAWNRRAPISQPAKLPCLYSDGNGGCRTMPGVPAQATPCDKPKRPWTCRMYKPKGGQP